MTTMTDGVSSMFESNNRTYRLDTERTVDRLDEIDDDENDDEEEIVDVVMNIELVQAVDTFHDDKLWSCFFFVEKKFIFIIIEW